MKADLHPNYAEETIHCSCGNEIKTRSTRDRMQLDVCNACHPFNTGEQRIVDTAGRVQLYNRLYQRR